MILRTANMAVLAVTLAACASKPVPPPPAVLAPQPLRHMPAMRPKPSADQLRELHERLRVLHEEIRQTRDSMAVDP